MPTFDRATIVRVTPLLLLAITGLAPGARSHTHHEPGRDPISWYPQDCCNDGDCRPAIYVGKTAQGIWLSQSGGMTILVGPRDRRLPSKDDSWHICIAPDETDTPAVRCIFEPQVVY